MKEPVTPTDPGIQEVIDSTPEFWTGLAVLPDACTMEIFKEFRFEAAHRLPNVEAGHKCERLHGHSYRVAVHVDAPVQSGVEWVMDFGDIAKAFAPIRESLDHYYLNEIEGLENPTSENLAKWIWDRLKPELPAMTAIVVRETCTSGCIYRGEE